MRLLTNAASRWPGPTVVKSVRLPLPIAEFVHAQVDGLTFANESQVLQHAIAFWCLHVEAKEARNGHQ